MTPTLSDKLRIKYGLTRNPTHTQIAEWRRRVEIATDAGADADADADAEQAGRSAALQVFGELDAVVLFSEADTIKALLARARAK